MARVIDSFLAAIRTAIYGKDVRSAIADGMEQGYDDLAAKIGSADEHFPETGKFVTGGNTASGNYSSATGWGTEATGIASHAEGTNDIVINFVPGGEQTTTYINTKATGTASHAEGTGTLASGGSSHAEGARTTASGVRSHAEGANTTASGRCSHAEGYASQASGENSHAEGNGVASGNYSHAEGQTTQAGGIYSHAEGYGIVVRGEAQHGFGKFNVIDSDETYVEIVGNGDSGLKRSNARTLDWSGNEELAGDLTIKKGTNDEKKMSDIVTGLAAAVSNIATIMNHFLSTNFKVGTNTTANGGNSVAEGTDCTASNQNAHAEGNGSVASGKNAHAEGGWNVGMIPGESGRRYSTASGTSSHSEGSGSHADGTATHAEGVATTAIGEGAHAEGRVTEARGTGSHAEGYCTVAYYNYQHVFGKFNATENGAEIVGGGVDADNRLNIRVLDWSGNEKLAGSLTLGMGTANEITLTAAQLRSLIALLS